MLFPKKSQNKNNNKIEEKEYFQWRNLNQNFAIISLD